jgi:hypothetical protein
MQIEDLEHIFKNQLENESLYFMLQDGDFNLVERHISDNLEALLPMLSHFNYAGSAANMPRFIK